MSRDATASDDKQHTQQNKVDILSSKSKRVLIGVTTIMISASILFGSLPNATLTIGSWLGIVQVANEGWEMLQSATISTPYTYGEILIAGALFAFSSRLFYELRVLVTELCYHTGSALIKTVGYGKVTLKFLTNRLESSKL